MTRPTILFCSQAAHVGGGVETWLEDLAAVLRKAGWIVAVALARGRFHDPARYLTFHSHPVHFELDGTSGFREQRFLSLLATFEEVQPDIIFPVQLADALYAAAHWKATGADTRLVTGMQKIKDEGMFGDLKACEDSIDLATTVSRRVSQELSSLLNVGPDRVVHIPTGVPAPAVEPQPRSRLARAAFIGRLDQDEKRVSDLADVIERLSDTPIEFHIVGGGPAESDLRQRLEGNRRVKFHGVLPRKELYQKIYPIVDVLLVFSKYEAGPMVAWEAMIHGVVPIVSDFAGRAEEGVIRHGKTGLVFPVGDVERAAEILRGAQKPGALLSLSRNSREQLPSAYQALEFARRWDAELRRCLELPIRRAPLEALPRPVSPGLIARLGLSPRATLRVRQFLRRRHLHAEPGGEWPHRYA